MQKYFLISWQRNTTKKIQPRKYNQDNTTEIIQPNNTTKIIQPKKYNQENTTKKIQLESPWLSIPGCIFKTASVYERYNQAVDRKYNQKI